MRLGGLRDGAQKDGDRQMKKRKKGEKPRPLSIKASFEGAESSGPIGKLTKATVAEWNEQKHRRPSREETELINSLFDGCPYAAEGDGAAHECIKYGFTGLGVQRYLCKRCGRQFTPLTGTVFDSKKIPISEWVEFIINLASYESLTQASLTNMKAKSTGRYWVSKVFEVLRGCQDGVVLGGDVWIDETYFKQTKSGLALHGGRKPRGLSHNLFCVATARDSKGHTVLVPCGRGKPDGERILRALGGHIAVGSRIIHDGENSHSLLISRLRCTEEAHPTAATKGLPDSRNPMDGINEVHRFLKKFMARHGGFKRDDLSDWMNLFWFVFTCFGRKDLAVNRFLKMAVKCRKIMRYRTVMGKKG